MIGEQLTIDDALARYPEDRAGYKRDGTSKEAAQALKGRAKAWAQIASLMAESKPMTADEISQRLNWSLWYGRPRVSEMVTMGSLKDSGDRGETANGKPATKWRLA